MNVWSWLKLTAALWLLRKTVKGIGWLLLAALTVTAWPLTLVAGLGYLAAWLRGWPPARLWRAAAWSLPMTAVYAIGEAFRLRAWPAVALAPVDDYGRAWRLLAEGTTRTQHAWIADPDLIRTLDTGQACYIHRGGATFVQVARPKPSPLSLPAAPSPSVIIPPPAPPPGDETPPPRPGAGSLDDVLGPGAPA